jgi:hypothetical protein
MTTNQTTATDKAASEKPPNYTNLEHHDLAKLFPEMSEAEFDALKEDIKANGLRVPITTLDDKILDGRNRYKACIAVSHVFKPEDFTRFKGLTVNALAFVISANVRRRHLNESQRAVIAASIVTTTLGYNRYSTGKITEEDAAKMLSVSVASLKTAKNLLEKGAKEVKEAVQTGKRRLGRVQKLLTLSHAEQVAELDKKPPPKSEQSGKKQQKQPDANPQMTAFDEFKKKWQGFDEMQKRAFVMAFKAEIATVLDYINKQEEMIGKAA